jgi:NADPH:quinone reductase-like Zn-dependent oxidoreductase
MQVAEAPFPTPGPDEIIIKNRAVAVNPVDWVLQDQGTSMAFGWIKYPFVFGYDVAGEVVQVGNKIVRFKVGDRVLGQAQSTDKTINSAAYGAFQLYTVLLERNSSPIPDTTSFESASVMPLAFTTAAAGLFEKDQLGLQYPQLDPKSTGKTVLVWGGSTSVGCNAIQLAVAAGYEVVSTSSPKNFDLLRSLGATEVFDYNDPCSVNKIVHGRKRMRGGPVNRRGCSFPLPGCTEQLQKRQTYRDGNISNPGSTETLSRAADCLELRDFDDLYRYQIKAKGYQNELHIRISSTQPCW